MLRITENLENGKTIRVRLDGTITTASYSNLEDVFARIHKTDTEVIILDMAGVVFMHDEVARKLATLRSEHLRIINCSPFIGTLLEAVDRNDDGR
jgi:hypothetical protein